MANLIQQKQAEMTAQNQKPAQKSISAMVNSMLDQNGLKRRFDELLGKRSAQFVSSVVSLITSDKNMTEAFSQNPMSIIQSALKAATFDLPVDQALGYAYIVPFRNKGVMTATFILGWKGMHQLALRTGAYKTINVTDVREGELKRYNRLTEEVEIDFIEDEDERNSKPVVGYVGYYRLVNGAEKTIYMSVKAIDAHEKKFRKGEHQGKGWRDDWDAMARKTVYRTLIGKWGIMSINYQSSEAGAQLADAITEENRLEMDAEYEMVPDSDPATGEVMEGKA